MKEGKLIGGVAFLNGSTPVTTITTITDHFDSVKQQAHQGTLISVKLVWSFRWWRWMYKYTWCY